MAKYLDFPAIAPVPEGLYRPFWSVMIPTYNCADYLRQTLKSVLEQDPGPVRMQIEVVDNCSIKDDPEAVVKEIGKGRVSFFRQPKNVGAQANFNTCIQRARGHWVHILHSDDAVMPGFYRAFEAAFEKEPAIGAAFCRHIFIDEQGNHKDLSKVERETPGILSDWLERICVRNLIQTPAIVVKRSVYEELGGYHPELFHAADWEMWKRIAMHYPVWYEPQLLAYYRQHSASDTSRLTRSGQNLANIRRAIEISQAYLPQPISERLSAQAREVYALRASNRARLMLEMGDPAAAIAHIRESLKFSRSFKVIKSVAGFFKWAVNSSIEKTLRKTQAKFWMILANLTKPDTPTKPVADECGSLKRVDLARSVSQRDDQN
jgi:glycosyltransferase involved in cell wall biosynthesis